MALPQFKAFISDRDMALERPVIYWPVFDFSRKADVRFKRTGDLTGEFIVQGYPAGEDFNTDFPEGSYVNVVEDWYGDLEQSPPNGRTINGAWEVGPIIASDRFSLICPDRWKWTDYYTLRKTDPFLLWNYMSDFKPATLGGYTPSQQPLI